jgi:CheY-like chemotaxis protein
MHVPFDSSLGPPISDRAIFAVDDNERERALFLQALREAGVKNPFRFFSNGDDMIDALFHVLRGGTPPLVVFLDLKLSGMCGLDVLRWIRLQDTLAEVSVVMLADPTDAPVVPEVLRCGAQCCTKKFPNAAELRTILTEAERFSTAASRVAAFDLPCNLLRAAS